MAFMRYLSIFVAILMIVFLFYIFDRLYNILKNLFVTKKSQTKELNAKRKKSYTETDYYNITHLPLRELYSDRGKYGEYQIYRLLDSLDIDKKFLFNVYIPKNGEETTEIDVIMLTLKGIYLFESKNYSGWIFGSEDDINWTQSFSDVYKRTHTQKFFNPIRQNDVHVKWLKKYLEETENRSVKVYSYIAFGKKCQLKKINYTKNYHKITKVNMLYEQIQKDISEKEDSFDENFIEYIYNKLYPLTQIGEDLKKKHIKYIKEKYREESNSNICPNCGGSLVIRKAKKGRYIGNEFYGCSNYPKCKYIQSINVNKNGKIDRILNTK